MPSAEVEVRPIRWSDLDDLREIYYRLYDERDAGEPIGITLFERRPSLSDEVTWFAHHYRNTIEGEEVFVVAEAAGRVVGSCNITRRGPGPGSETAHVGHLGILVDRDYRGIGVGTALMGRALAEARSKFEILLLTVFSINERAQRLYRRYGFTVCGHQPRAVKRGSTYFDEEEMILDLTAMSPGTGANR